MFSEATCQYRSHLRARHELNSVAREPSVRGVAKAVDGRTILLPILEYQVAIRRQRSADTVQQSLSVLHGHVVQDVAKHHQVIVPRFGGRNFLNVAIFEADMI